MDAKRRNYNLRNIIRNEEMADPVEPVGNGRRQVDEGWDNEF